MRLQAPVGLVNENPMTRRFGSTYRHDCPSLHRDFVVLAITESLVGGELIDSLLRIRVGKIAIVVLSIILMMFNL